MSENSKKNASDGQPNDAGAIGSKAALDYAGSYIRWIGILRSYYDDRSDIDRIIWSERYGSGRSLHVFGSDLGRE